MTQTVVIDWEPLWPLIDGVGRLTRKHGLRPAKADALLEYFGFDCDNVLHLYGLLEAVRVFYDGFGDFLEGWDGSLRKPTTKLCALRMTTTLTQIHRLLPRAVKEHRQIREEAVVIPINLAGFNCGLLEDRVRSAQAAQRRATPSAYGPSDDEDDVTQLEVGVAATQIQPEAWSMIYVTISLLTELELNNLEHNAQTATSLEIIELFCHHTLLLAVDAVGPHLQHTIGY